MTTESFCTIREVSEVPEGLRILHRDGQVSVLPRNHERYGRIEEMLRRAQRRSVPWPVRIARSPEGVIVNAWGAWGGRPVLVEEEPTGECTIYFSLLNSRKILKRDHPEFQRLLETLMEATGSRLDVFYFEVPGEQNVLADVCFAG